MYLILRPDNLVLRLLLGTGRYDRSRDPVESQHHDAASLANMVNFGA